MNPFWESEFPCYVNHSRNSTLFFELSFLCKRGNKSLKFLSFGRQKQTPLFNISLVSFVFRAVLMRK